jgi:hypothetical protein
LGVVESGVSAGVGGVAKEGLEWLGREEGVGRWRRNWCGRLEEMMLVWGTLMEVRGPFLERRSGIPQEAV